MNNTTIRYGIAAVAVVAVALVGINFLAPGGLGGPAPSASPTSKPTPTVAATVPPSAICNPLLRDAPSLAVGRYCIDDVFPMPVTFDISNIGWVPFVPSDDHAALLAGDSWGLAFLEVGNLYADPCDPSAGVLDPALGPTADDLIAAFREEPRYEVSDESEVTIDGYSGIQVEISAAYEAGECTEAETSWGVSPSGFAADGSMVPTPDRPIWLWVGHVEGTRLVITHPLSALPSLAEWASGVRSSDRHASDLLELDAIVESLRFNQ